MLSDFGLVETKAKSVRPGDVYERLTVIATGQIPGTYRYMAVCRCDCGSPLKAIRFDGLQSGTTTSCGCVQRVRSTTHGLTRSGHSHRWRAMMARCYDQNDQAFPSYGGRGIRVCDAWHSLAGFVAGLPPGHFTGAEIDRIDNDGDYEPGNVRWATRQQNADNRRSRRAITHLCRTQSVTAWAREYGLPPSLVRDRIVTWGWDVERALTTPPVSADERMATARAVRWGNHQKPPPRPRKVIKTVDLNGETLTIEQLSARTGISKELLRKRLFERGWSVEKAAQSHNFKNAACPLRSASDQAA